MKCKTCKHEIEDDSIYCRFCGEKQLRERRKKAEVKVPAPKQLPSGTWFGRITVDGKRVSISAATEKDYYSQAKATKAGLIKAESAKAKVTLRQAMRKYVDERSSVVAPGTVRGWEYTIKGRFTAYIDKDINAINWQQMINDEAEKHSPKTVINAWSLARPAVKQCGITLPDVTLPKKVKYEGDFLDYEEIVKFLAEMRGSRSELAAILALHSLRISEILDLEVEDINGGYIKVNGAIVRDKNDKLVQKDTNKNETSTRRVPVLIPRLYELLPDEGHLVTMAQSTINSQFVSACKRANITVVTLHDLRRSFASLAKHLKWDDETTIKLGGWKDTKVLKEVYEKIAEQDRNKDIQKMKRYYSKLATKMVTSEKS